MRRSRTRHVFAGVVKHVPSQIETNCRFISKGRKKMENKTFRPGRQHMIPDSIGRQYTAESTGGWTAKLKISGPGPYFVLKAQDQSADLYVATESHGLN